jgi:hypothetical protein
LKKLSSSLKISLTPQALEQPTTAWEYLVTKLSTKSPKLQASVAEKKLKKITADLIIKEKNKRLDCYLKSPLQNELTNLLANGEVHLLNLNFDRLAYFFNTKTQDLHKKTIPAFDKLGFDSIRKSDIQLLFRRIRLERKSKGINTSMVWHPHGCADRPDTIRMGLRDYGIMPSYYTEAFKNYKEWQRSILGRRSTSANPITALEHEKLLSRLHEIDSCNLGFPLNAADNWVTRFMLLPVSMIGVGLSNDEFGLRWLLTQRSRDLARLKTNTSSVRLYGCKYVLSGVVGVDFSDWDLAWDAALNEVKISLL